MWLIPSLLIALSIAIAYGLGVLYGHGKGLDQGLRQGRAEGFDEGREHEESINQPIIEKQMGIIQHQAANSRSYRIKIKELQRMVLTPEETLQVLQRPFYKSEN